MRNNPDALNRYQNRNWLRQNWRSETLRGASAQKVANTLVASGDQFPENAGEILKFWLSEAEVASIWADIKSNLPLGSPAMTKLFSALEFSDVSENEMNGKLTLWVNQYEVVKIKAQRWPNTWKEVSVIRMPNHILESEKIDMVSKVINAIRSLFPDKTINFTLEALNASANKHGIFSGFRFADSAKSRCVDGSVFSWIGGTGGATIAQYACQNRSGLSGSNVGDRRDGFCLVASVG
jgi:hypothetical protein